MPSLFHRPGSTAYGGLIDVLRPSNRDQVMAAGGGTKAGEDAGKPDGKVETVWVSGAAGAVGSLVGQMAKNVFGRSKPPLGNRESAEGTDELLRPPFERSSAPATVRVPPPAAVAFC